MTTNVAQKCKIQSICELSKRTDKTESRRLPPYASPWVLSQSFRCIMTHLRTHRRRSLWLEPRRLLCKLWEYLFDNVSNFDYNLESLNPWEKVIAEKFSTFAVPKEVEESFSFSFTERTFFYVTEWLLIKKTVCWLKRGRKNLKL